MDTVQLKDSVVKELEHAESRYWSELYLASSAILQRKLGIKVSIVGGAFCGAMSAIDTLAFNRVLGFGIDFPADDDQVKSIISFYKQAGVERFFVSPYLDWTAANTKDLLLKNDFTHYNNWVKFYKELSYPLAEVETDLNIAPVQIDETVQFDQIIKSAFSWDDDAALIFSQTLGRPGWKHYFAKEGAKPVAAAAMYIWGDFASLAIAGTLPEYRGRGAQGALITRRINDAIIEGCSYLSVETAEDKDDKPSASNRNMHRFGFELAYVRPNFIYYNK